MGVNSAVISAIIYQESKFETWKESWAGAYGLFQFMPATAQSYGINRNSSPKAQIAAGVKKLNKNIEDFNPKNFDKESLDNFVDSINDINEMGGEMTTKSIEKKLVILKTRT